MGANLLGKTREVHELQAHFYVELETMEQELPKMEKRILTLERQHQFCSKPGCEGCAEKNKKRLQCMRIREGREALREQISQNLADAHESIGRHRSEMGTFRAKADDIQERIKAHMALQQKDHRKDLSQEESQRFMLARDFSKKLVLGKSITKGHSVLDAGASDPEIKKLIDETLVTSVGALQSNTDWKLMLQELSLEDALHLKDLLYDRGVRSVANLAKLSVEHVRSLPCNNRDKTALLHSSRSARQRLAFTATGVLDESDGEKEASVALLTSRNSGGFLPLFSHRVDILAKQDVKKCNMVEEIRNAVKDRNVELIRKLVANEDGGSTINSQCADGWTVLHRACLHKLDHAVPPKSVFSKRNHLVRGEFKAAPWVHSFGLGSLNASHRIAEVERLQKLDDENIVGSGSNAKDPLASTQRSAFSSTVGSRLNTARSYLTDASWLSSEVPSPCKLLLHSIRDAYRSSVPQSNLGPRELADHQCNTQVIEVLLQARADVHAKNKYGRTALHYAAMEGNLSACRLLVEAGALPDEMDIHGFTPVQHAVLMKRADWDSCHDHLTQVMMTKPSDAGKENKTKGKKKGKGKKGKKKK